MSPRPGATRPRRPSPGGQPHAGPGRPTHGRPTRRAIILDDLAGRIAAEGLEVLVLPRDPPPDAGAAAIPRPETRRGRARHPRLIDIDDQGDGRTYRPEASV